MINIVFITDEAYLMATIVAIRSLKKSNVENRINVYVVAVDITDLDKEKTESESNDNVSVTVIRKSGEQFAEFMGKHPHVSSAALCKMILPSLLPEVDKVLYLDGDMLIVNDLEELYSIDVENYYAAVVTDYKAYAIIGREHLIPVDKYFNSGMMLLNLKTLREENISETLLADKKNDKKSIFMDQDTLNRVFDGHLKYINPRFNFMVDYENYEIDELAKLFEMTKEETVYISKNPIVLHLTDAKKPWNSFEAKHQEEWMSFVRPEEYIRLLEDSYKKTDAVRELMESYRTIARSQKPSPTNTIDRQTQNELDFYRNYYEKLSVVQKSIRKNRIQIIERFKGCPEESIWIYGTGKVATSIYWLLVENEMTDKLAGFFVTEDGAEKQFCGKKILQFSTVEEALEKNKNTVVLAIRLEGSEHENLIKKIEESGFAIIDINKYL